jgi:hypothetical protein
MAHPSKQALFVLLSLADLALTCWLLERSGGHLYEANPVAHWWLARHGWAGLACFKAGVVLLVLGLAAVIARSRPRAAGRVLGLGCAGLTLVVLYSAALVRAAARSPAEREARVAREHEKYLGKLNRQAGRELRMHEAFRDLMAELCQELIAGRCTLRQAQQRLAASEKARDPAWLRGLAAAYPGRPPQELMAACIIAHVRALPDAPSVARRAALRLEREFGRTYGRPAPGDAGPEGDATARRPLHPY